MPCGPFRSAFDLSLWGPRVSSHARGRSEEFRRLDLRANPGLGPNPEAPNLRGERRYRRLHLRRGRLPCRRSEALGSRTRGRAFLQSLRGVRGAGAPCHGWRFGRHGPDQETHREGGTGLRPFRVGGSHPGCCGPDRSIVDHRPRWPACDDVVGEGPGKDRPFRPRAFSRSARQPEPRPFRRQAGAGARVEAGHDSGDAAPPGARRRLRRRSGLLAEPRLSDRAASAGRPRQDRKRNGRRPRFHRSRAFYVVRLGRKRSASAHPWPRPR